MTAEPSRSDNPQSADAIESEGDPPVETVKSPVALHPLQRAGAVASIVSCVIAIIVLQFTVLNFSRSISPEEKRREAILKELSYDYAASLMETGQGLPSNSQEYRDGASTYINRHLEEMNEPWRYDPKTDHSLPLR